MHKGLYLADVRVPVLDEGDRARSILQDLLYGRLVVPGTHQTQTLTI